MIDTPTRTDATLALRDGYQGARERGMTRHRDIAESLGVSEGALIAAHVQAGNALSTRRLQPQWPQILQALQAAGEVMALTRNDSCVHEKTGTYQNLSGEGAVGMVLGPEIDLRLFYSHWAHGFAVDEVRARDVQRSLQFFDASGTAVHKVFAKPDTDLAAWRALVQRFASDDGATELIVQPIPARAEAPDAQIDIARLHSDWSALRDTHEFFTLLKRHGVTRTQALRLADPAYAQPVDAGSARELLRAAADSGTPIMVFVGNRGAIQIHSGPVQRIEIMGPWLNVLDRRFNLHLREDRIAQSWVVRKPTTDGVVTSLEVFDAAGETIAMCFGERKPGKPERCEWRRLVDRLVADARWAGQSTPCASC